MNAERYIRLLRTIAEDVAPVGKARLAAAVLYKSKIIAIGVNQYKTHPFAVEYSKHPEAMFLHAETDAIFKARKKLTDVELKKSTLIVVRVKSSNQHNETVFGLAKPCTGCTQCITDHGIRTVIYTENSERKQLRYVTEVW
jgi:deoxycytidylate deaminase